MLRFSIVGGIAFVFDWGILMLVLRFVFGGVESNFSMTIATAAGFIVGVTVNYILSVLFVFKSARQGKGKDAKSVLIFLIASAVGLGINEVVMVVGSVNMGYNTTLVKVIATAIVTVWNYVSRKVLIFK